VGKSERRGRVGGGERDERERNHEGGCAAGGERWRRGGGTWRSERSRSGTTTIKTANAAGNAADPAATEWLVTAFWNHHAGPAALYHALTGKLAWAKKFGPIFSSAVAGLGMVYIASTDGYLYALNPDGGLRWRYKTGNAITSSPTIGADGTVYVIASRETEAIRAQRGKGAVVEQRERTGGRNDARHCPRAGRGIGIEDTCSCAHTRSFQSTVLQVNLDAVQARRAAGIDAAFHGVLRRAGSIDHACRDGMLARLRRRRRRLHRRRHCRRCRSRCCRCCYRHRHQRHRCRCRRHHRHRRCRCRCSRRRCRRSQTSCSRRRYRSVARARTRYQWRVPPPRKGRRAALPTIAEDNA